MPSQLTPYLLPPRSHPSWATPPIWHPALFCSGPPLLSPPPPGVAAQATASPGGREGVRLGMRSALTQQQGKRTQRWCDASKRTKANVKSARSASQMQSPPRYACVKVSAPLRMRVSSAGATFSWFCFLEVKMFELKLACQNTLVSVGWWCVWPKKSKEVRLLRLRPVWRYS